MRNPLRNPCRMALVALLMTCCAQAADPPAEPRSIFQEARLAILNNDYTASKVIGAHMDRYAFTELPAQGAILVGFDLGMGKWLDFDVIYALRPVYMTANGEISYRERGIFTDVFMPNKKPRKNRVTKTVYVRAKPGYAVGAMTIRSGLYFNGIDVTFMKIQGTTLDPDQSYVSPWYGDRTGGLENVIDGKGAPVFGVHGSADEDYIRSLGLYFGQPPRKVVKKEEVPPIKKEPAKVEKVEKAADPAVAPAQPAAPAAAAPAVEEPRGFNWLPYAIFGAVTVAVFAVLLVGGQREQKSKQGSQPDAPVPGAIARLPAKASPWGSEARPVQPLETTAAPTNSFDNAKAIKEVRNTLYAIAALQLGIGLLVTLVAPQVFAGPNAGPEVVTGMGMTVILVAAAYFGLARWASSQPLLAAGLGLTLAVGLTILDFKAAPELMQKGIFVRVAIIAALAKAVSVAAKIKPASAWADSSPPELEAPVRRLLEDVEANRPKEVLPIGSKDRYSPGDVQLEAPVRQLLHDMESKGQPAPAPTPAARPDGSKAWSFSDDAKLDAPVRQLLRDIETKGQPPTSAGLITERPDPPAWSAASRSQPTGPLSEPRLRPPKPWWVEVGLWKINDRNTAWIFLGISVLMAVLPAVVASVAMGSNRFFISGIFILAAVWYWLCIKWMDDNDGW